MNKGHICDNEPRKGYETKVFDLSDCCEEEYSRERLIPCFLPYCNISPAGHPHRDQESSV